HKIHLLGKAEIESSIIGDIVLEELKCIDDVAYLRFASVYKDFSDADSFKKEAEEIKKKDAKKYCKNRTI
ncbi:MAG: transcriptional regulator NrdR, partial [Patescibacteria group bacterium]|nr:transcriptional regulator NrdR [Patescibacteria group bacterium]